MADTPFGRKIEREGPGDAEEWIKVQQNTFTKWINSHLQRKSMEVEDLSTDLSDGLKLLGLLEVIGGEKPAKKFNRNPRMRIQQMENLNLAFEYMRSKGLKLTNIGSTDILDGNMKLILGLIWTLILRFEVADIDIEGASGKEGLLLWCKRCVRPYGLPMENFTMHWKNGLAFCGLIHHHRPDLIDYDTLSPENDKENLELAFAAAERSLGVARLLEVDDIADSVRPDEKSVVTYVTQLYQAFTSGKKKETSVETVQKAIDIARRHDQWYRDYASGASEIMSWLEDCIARFENLGSIGSLSDIKEQMEALNTYKRIEKPPKETVFLGVQSTLGRLQTSCASSGRQGPSVSPELSTIQEKWAELDSQISSREAELRNNYEKFLKLDFELSQFTSAAEKLSNWVEEKSKTFNAELSKVSKADTERLLDAHSGFEEQQRPRFGKILSDLQENVKSFPGELAGAQKAKEKVEELEAALNTLDDESANYKGRLEANLEEQLRLDTLEKQVHHDAPAIVSLLESLEEALHEPYMANNIENIRTVQQTFQSNVVPEIEKVRQDGRTLQGLVQQLQEGGRTVILPDISVEDLFARIDNLENEKDARMSTLVDALDKASRQDDLCRLFAALATKFKQVCEAVSEQTRNDQGSLEEQLRETKAEYNHYQKTTQERSSLIGKLAVEEVQNESSGALSTIRQEYGVSGASLVRVETVNAALEAEHVLVNPHTTETIQSLRAVWEALGSVFAEKIQQLESQISLDQSGILTDEQLREIKEIFNYFDEDKDGLFEIKEFSKACIAYGLDLDEEDAKAAFDKLDKSHDGRLSLAEFSNFCASELLSGTSKDDVIAAFANLANNKQYITANEIDDAFSEAEYSQYIKENMPSSGEDEMDYQAFTENLFSK